QILARLDHPAVARLLDGGTTAAGHPYLVMEFVRGRPIDRYCDEEGLSIRQRLELFREVCEAVHDAHGHLVVHRDLKPSNILVTENGHPKLLDFGISKLLAPDDGAGAETTLGHCVLTPQYASPEQIRDQPITTAVDVYALGLLLNRLLTGTDPYPVRDSSGAELRRVICEVDAQRPSAAVRKLARDDREKGEGRRGPSPQRVAAARGTTPAKLVKTLIGDLDHIVLKALRKEPRERYRSVDRLAADVGRHLGGRPVEARRGGLRYRAGRLLKRHRTVAAATLAAALALLLGLIGQAREAQRAQREALVSERVVGFLTELFDASDPTETLEDVTVADLLDRAVNRVESELQDQPRVRARLMSTLARVHHNRGRFEQSLALAQGVLELHRNARSTEPAKIAAAHLDVADNLRVLGRLQEAGPHYEQALGLRREHFGDASLETAQALNNKALLLIRLAELEPAQELLLEVLDIRRRAPGQEYLTSQTLHNLALIAMRNGEYERVRTLAAESLAIKEEVLHAGHPSQGRTLALLAGALRELAEYPAAEQALRRALEIFRGAWDENHVDVLAAEGDLAEVRHLLGDQELAEVEQRRVLGRKREFLGQEHAETALTYAALASQLEDQGRLKEALPLFEKALEIRRKLLPADHPTLGFAM
ncbi:MAG: tetratricopeptide repeat protein, partial [Acidobacteriota bacterium]